MAKKNKVKESRESEAISRAELARVSNLSEKTIKRVEDGTRSFTSVTKNRIVNGLNSLKNSKRAYTIEYLFSD